MHPLQIVGMLHGYFARIAKLTDPEIRNPADAVAALGGRVKEYPARKALDQARALGTDGMREAFDHLFAADLDLKGARAIPEDAVMEVLVARLASLSARAGRRGGRPAIALTALGDQAPLAARRMRRHVRRAAWFLWITPFEPALPRRFCAAFTRSASSVAALVHRHFGRLHPRLELGADGLVAQAALLVLTVALVLTLDVRHEPNNLAAGTAST